MGIELEQKEFFRTYANAIETAVVTEETEDYIKGYSDLIRLDTELLEKVNRMLLNKDNAEGRKMAVLLCKHEKESVRYMAEKVMKKIPFEVVDRTDITL